MTKQFEGLGDKWKCLLADPNKELAGLAEAVARDGGTRERWRRADARSESVLLAYPPDHPIRGAVVVCGAPDGAMSIKTICPLLEGLPNDMTVAEVCPWKSGVEGNVAGRRNEDASPLWFYTPLLFRDREDLTPDVRQTILLAGLAMGLRRALIDEMTIVRGPIYERYAADWLAEHPDATRLDVPQLRAPLKGVRILQPGRAHCEYEFRAPITSVDSTNFGPQTVHMLHMQFGLDTENPLDVMVYVPAKICGSYVPEAGDEVDGYIWLQGRMLDI